MNKKELKKKLKESPGYLKSGAPKVSKLFNISVKKASKAIREVNEELKDVETNQNLKAAFLRWKEKTNYTAPVPNSQRPVKLPKPFLTGDVNNVLVIGDLHEPFCLDGYLEFCRKVQEDMNCGTVVFIGDIIDNHYASYHESELDTYGPNEEFQRAKDKVANWYKVFPKAHVTIGNHDRMTHRKAKTAGIADKWVRSYGEALETPNWKFVEQVILNNVCYNHGEGGTAFTRAKNESMSQVQGHLHSQGYVNYSVGERIKIFGFQVGCGIDRNQFAFAYGKSGKKPIISCGVVLNCGELPILIPMNL